MWDTGLLQAKTKSALPTISDYLDTFNNPYGCFRTLGEPEPQTNARGEIIFYAGNNSAIFPAEIEQGKISLKCYIKNGLYTNEIYSYLSHVDDPLLTPIRLLKEEIFVYDVFGNGSYHDIVCAEWVNGITLETALRRAARNDGFTYSELSAAFERMALQLLDREWAHGDLKPENIIVRPDGTLRLIDYDAMFIPELSGRRTLEIGTPPYQHPLRDETMFDKHLDDYAVALIAVSLRALALEPTLYGRYNRADNIIIYPSDIFGGGSEAYEEMLRLFARRGDHASYDLALSLQAGSIQIINLRESLRPHRVIYPSVGKPAMKAAEKSPTYNKNNSCPKLFSENGRWGFRDHTGRNIIPPVYEDAYEFSEGAALVRIDGIWQFLDTAGNMILDCSQYDSVKPFSEGYTPVRAAGKWGYLAMDGRIAIEPAFDMAGIFHEGLAVVRVGGKYGYIDRDGGIVIPPVYEYATGFRNGRAEVKLKEETFLIDTCGDRK